jgi:hypothetical protein
MPLSFPNLESRTSSQAEEDLSPHIQSQREVPTGERESHGSGHEQHNHYSAQAETTTSTAATSMMPAMTNYNVNVQFDPATQQAGKQIDVD